ncbi:MAG: multiheme c-type cytochrome [Archangium sp.]|nr:multiheme c-type cytochrome [Archangium sp.]
MTRGANRVHLALALLLLAGCTTSRPLPGSGTPKKVTLFFTAEVRGYLGPCGCSENMRGGVSRAAFQVAEARKAGTPVYLLDTGDGLFGTLQLPEAAVPQQERKAKALADAWKAMGLTLRATGPLDDVRGASFRQGLGLPELPSGTFKLIDGVGVVSAPTAAGARSLAVEAKKAGARFVVAMVPLPFDQLLREAIDPAQVDLFVSSRSKDEFAAEESRLAGGATKVAQLQSKGRSLLRIDVFMHGDGRVEWLKGDGERDRELSALDQRIELLRGQVNEPMLGDELKALRKAKLEEIIARRELLAETPLAVPEGKAAVTARFVPLESSFPKDPAVQALEKAYDVDVGLINLEWAKAHGVSCPPATPERSGFIGTAACFECHAEAQEVFDGTKHPRAYATLVEVGKQHHLDCISCHVTGWQQPQGVCRIDQTAGREDVGCEACHGPGSAHAKQPFKTNIVRGAEPKTCVGCHDRENSPHFDFDRYLEKILGKGHGRK